MGKVVNWLKSAESVRIAAPSVINSVTLENDGEKMQVYIPIIFDAITSKYHAFFGGICIAIDTTIDFTEDRATDWLLNHIDEVWKHF